MIDKREIRIGNKIRYSDHEVTVEQLPHTNHVQTEEVINGDLSQYDGVELTPEILVERCGFTKWGRDDMPSTVTFELGGITVAPLRECYGYDGKGFGWFWTKKEENNSLSWRPKVELKYLHQLQNLYFVLEAEELKINKR